ncbi:hypothetical protein KAT51_03870 [bacterium]|nr:hypothetical protein [bacterium]
MAKKRIILLGCLLLALVLVTFSLRKSRRPRMKMAPLPEVPSVTEEKKASPAPEGALVTLEIKRVKGPISWGRDPFLSPLVKRVLEAGAPRAGALVLTGIVRDEEGVQAIIGDYIVNLGDIINGKKVIRIGKNEVVLIKGKEQETLKLKEE